MTKRPYDSGRRDRLGRRISVANKTPKPGAANTAKLAQATKASADPIVSWRQDPATAGLMREIKDAATDAADLVSRTTEEDFKQDRLLQRSAASIAIQIGEAANKLDDAFRAVYPAVPWQPIIKMRHILAHHYVDADPDVLWSTMRSSVPDLAQQLDAGSW